MTTPIPPPPSSWSERVAIVRRNHEMESRLTAPVSERMLDLAGLRLGMRVLDLASGMGEPCLRAAHRVGPSGYVLGTDLVDAMLEPAREQARAQGLSHLELRAVDAEALDAPEQSFDVATVRWGLMYMARPEQALTRVWRALRPGGLLVCACWGGPEQVEYATLPRRTMERFRPLPPVAPEAPSVFRFSTPERLRPVLEQAGFTLEHVESMHVPVMEATDGMDAARWFRSFGGPVAKLLEELPPETQRAWEEAVARECEPYGRDGKVLLGGVTWLGVARRAGAVTAG
jgi:ubiquinone/menaquinone biosynthesis C-methylase UbiE